MKTIDCTFIDMDSACLMILVTGLNVKIEISILIRKSVRDRTPGLVCAYRGPCN